jgi:hypothetical protein
MPTLPNTIPILTLDERSPENQVAEHDAPEGKGNHYAKGTQKRTHYRNNHKNKKNRGLICNEQHF